VPSSRVIWVFSRNIVYHWKMPVCWNRDFTWEYASFDEIFIRGFYGRIGFLVKMPQRKRHFSTPRKNNMLFLWHLLRLGPVAPNPYPDHSFGAGCLVTWLTSLAVHSVLPLDCVSASPIKAILHSLSNSYCRNLNLSPNNKAWDSAKLFLLSWPNIIYSLEM